MYSESKVYEEGEFQGAFCLLALRMRNGAHTGH